MTSQAANPYAVLGVPPTASASQVRDAYRRLAKQFHPDRHPDAGATERMQRINQAFDTLSRPAARERYEAQAAVPHVPHPHWGGATRSSSQPYGPQPRWAEPPWATSHGTTGTEAVRDDDIGPLRFGLLLVLVPVAVLLTALFGALVPLPILGLIVFFIARVAFASGD